MPFAPPVQRELDHAARWISLLKDTDPAGAARWQTRWDEVYDKASSVVAVASDGEVLHGDQSSWVTDQAMVVHNTDMTDSRLGRVIKRIGRGDDDGEDGKLVPV